MLIQHRGRLMIYVVEVDPDCDSNYVMLSSTGGGLWDIETCGWK